MFRTLSKMTALLFLVSGAGCLGTAPTGSTNPAPVGDPSSGGQAGGTSGGFGLAPQTSSGGQDNTFNHDNGDEIDPFQVLARIQQEGPPEISSRLHSCQKMKYETLGTVLTSLGVDMSKQSTPPSAGQLYQGGSQAMGAPNYLARVAEATENTTAGATKLFDIFTQAAPEIIAAMPNQAQCQVAGQPTQMFDANGQCTQAGISCLTGAPASQAQVDLCNQALTQASSSALGQQIAVATILAAAHTCE
jgi:hypothetical protein